MGSLETYLSLLFIRLLLLPLLDVSLASKKKKVTSRKSGSFFIFRCSRGTVLFLSRIVGAAATSLCFSRVRVFVTHRGKPGHVFRCTAEISRRSKAPRFATTLSHRVKFPFLRRSSCYSERLLPALPIEARLHALRSSSFLCVCVL